MSSKQIIAYNIISMKNLQKKLSVKGDDSICPASVIVRDGSILLGLRNYTSDKWKNISVWTTPGGRCNGNETIETALRREVQEEVGISDFEIAAFIGEVPGAKEGDVVPVFYCTTRQDARLMEPEKFSEWRWVPLQDYLSSKVYGQMNPAAHKLISEYLECIQ
mgnify:CR=1 FL=1